MLIGVETAIAETRTELSESLSERVKLIQTSSNYNREVPSVKVDKTQLVCLARNIYFESRGESEKGMKAVAWVTLNRVQHKSFPNSVCGVVHQRGGRGCQFSWFCDGAPDRVRHDESWMRSLKIAMQVLSGQSSDPTHGATHYYNYNMVSPVWGRKFQRTATIGNHSFHRMI